MHYNSLGAKWSVVEIKLHVVNIARPHNDVSFDKFNSFQGH
jgi:hypothetical protein